MPNSNYYLRLCLDIIINISSLYFAYYSITFYYNNYFDFSCVNIYFLIPSWYISSRISGLYKEFFNRSLSAEIMKVYKTIFINIFLIILADYLLISNIHFTRPYLIFFFSCNILFTELECQFRVNESKG